MKIFKYIFVIVTKYFVNTRQFWSKTQRKKIKQNKLYSMPKMHVMKRNHITPHGNIAHSSLILPLLLRRKDSPTLQIWPWNLKQVPFHLFVHWKTLFQMEHLCSTSSKKSKDNNSSHLKLLKKRLQFKYIKIIIRKYRIFFRTTKTNHCQFKLKIV